jgi:2-dehydropantoate 2-reductase
MRVCIVGAGAIGGFLAARFALAGIDVTVVARGAHLDAIRARGLRLISHDGQEQVVHPLRAVRTVADAGEQDVVILGMKAHQVEPVARELSAAMHPETVVIPMQNGIPWWYFQRLPAGSAPGLADRPVRTVDPHGVVAAAIAPSRIVGCVVYPACELQGPGLIRHVEGERFPLGELDGVSTERVQALSGLFQQAGLKAPVLDNIRAEIWLKLWGNLSFNPISALAHSTLVDICQYPPSRELAANMMREAEAVAQALGISFRVSLERRIAGAERVGKHKTSMLQDVEAGRDPEIDALVGAVIELGQLVEVPTPHIDAVYALVKLLGRTMHEEKVYVRAQPLPA